MKIITLINMTIIISTEPQCFSTKFQKRMQETEKVAYYFRDKRTITHMNQTIVSTATIKIMK